MMISGPRDIGKTALILNVLRNLPDQLAGNCLYIAGFKDLQDLLRNVLKSLYRVGNPALRRQLRTERVSAANFEVWLRSLSVTRLKGTLYRAIEGSDYRVILDQTPPLTHAIAKVVKELFWMRETPVCLLVRDGPEDRVDQFSHFFYWGRRERLALGPLPRPVAAGMLEWCIGQFGLAGFDSREFRHEVLELSDCVPGAITKMCAMALDKRYQHGSRIKTKLVHIDYMMAGQDFGFSAAKRTPR